MPKSNISIKKYDETLFQQTVDWLNQTDIQELFGITFKVDLQSHKKWVQENPHVEFLPLYVDESYIGNIVLTHCPRHLSSYLQIYIGANKYRGQGLGQQFMMLALEHVFKVKTFHRLWLHVRDSNVPALKLYQSLGFQTEGIERDSIKVKERFISQYRMSLLSTDKPESDL